MPTISMSEKFCTAARNTMRPMRPKPLMPILMVMSMSLCLEVMDSGFAKRSLPATSYSAGTFIPAPQQGLLADDLARDRDDVVRRDVEELEQVRRRRRFAEAVQADDGI